MRPPDPPVLLPHRWSSRTVGSNAFDLNYQRLVDGKLLLIMLIIYLCTEQGRQIKIHRSPNLKKEKKIGTSGGLDWFNETLRNQNL